MSPPQIPPSEHASDDFARLIARAGKRRSPATGVSESVRTAVEQAWRHSTAHRHRRRRLWLSAVAAATLAATVGLSWLGWSRPGMAGPVATVVSERGKVAFKENHRPVLVAMGGLLPTGTHVRTGTSGSAVLDVASVAMHVGPATSIRLERPDHVELTRGRIYAARGVTPVAARPLVVDTPFGRVSHLGTAFQVVVDSSGMTISVRGQPPTTRTSGACAALSASRTGCLVVAQAVVAP